MTRPELPNLTTARERVDSARSLSIHLEILSLTVDPIDWRAGCANSACPNRAGSCQAKWRLQNARPEPDLR